MARGRLGGRRMMTWLGVGGVAAVGGMILFVCLVVLLIAGPFVGGGDNGPRTIVNSKGIPDEYLGLIVSAANDAGCAEITPAVLAAQLYQESGFNPRAQSPVGAMGIAQFMPGTWATHGGGGDVWNPADAIPAAAKYDCSLAAAVAAVPGGGQEKMLAAYNAGPGAVLSFSGIPPFPETQNYVRVILAKALEYGDALTAGASVPAGSVEPVLDFMRSQVGKPYVWGSTGPDTWDCSSLVQAAYRTIGIELPRDTFSQVNAAPRVSGADLSPGDLLFTPGSDGTIAAPGHVGMYIGDGQVIDAKGARWGVVLSDVSAWTTVVTVLRPLAGKA
jgi:cell wall-associated NlpC family hydrolase